MFTFVLYTKDQKNISNIFDFIFQNYNKYPVQTYDVNWNGHSEEWDYITAFTIDTEIDDSEIFTNFNVFCRQLTGNNFIDIVPHTKTIDDYIAIIESVLQDKSKEYGYDNIVSACSYKDSTVEKYRNESTAFIQWRDHLWSISLEEAKSNLETSPIDLEEFKNSFPTYESFLGV